MAELTYRAAIAGAIAHEMDRESSGGWLRGAQPPTSEGAAVSHG